MSLFFHVLTLSQHKRLLSRQHNIVRGNTLRFKIDSLVHILAYICSILITLTMSYGCRVVVQLSNLSSRSCQSYFSMQLKVNSRVDIVVLRTRMTSIDQIYKHPKYVVAVEFYERCMYTARTLSIQSCLKTFAGSTVRNTRSSNQKIKYLALFIIERVETWA